VQNRNTLIAAIVVAGLAGAAHAQTGWTFVSIDGNPDNITAFDTENPIASQMVIGNTAGNFIRGFDWADQNTAFYHMSTDTTNNPGDAGIWRYDALTNTSAQLFQFGFNDASTGGGDFFNGSYFLTIDNGSGTDALYRFDNLGGAISSTLVGFTGLAGIQSLAIDPLTGTIYAANTTDNSLYSISAANGAATLVGGLGVTVSAVGGMDFSADASTLLMTTQFGRLYEINAFDASVITNFGDIGPNISALSYRVPAPGAMALLGLGAMVGIRRRR
jgi:hypothetical protein